MTNTAQIHNFIRKLNRGFVYLSSLKFGDLRNLEDDKNLNKIQLNISKIVTARPKEITLTLDMNTTIVNPRSPFSFILFFSRIHSYI